MYFLMEGIKNCRLLFYFENCIGNVNNQWNQISCSNLSYDKIIIE